MLTSVTDAAAIGSILSRLSSERRMATPEMPPRTVTMIESVATSAAASRARRIVLASASSWSRVMYAAVSKLPPRRGGAAQDEDR